MSYLALVWELPLCLFFSGAHLYVSAGGFDERYNGLQLPSEVDD